MLKRLIDTLRAHEGYAGMAVYVNGNAIFNDMLDRGLSDRIKCVFEEYGAIYNADRMMAVIHGYTINGFMAGDMLVICRLEGRFRRAEAPGEEEPSYATGQEERHLIKREEARKEAESMLKLIMKGQ